MMAKHKLSILFLVFMTLNLLNAQDNFSQIDTILKHQYKSFDKLNLLMRNSNRDSMAMKQLLIKSRAIKYKEGEIYALNMLGKMARIKTDFAKAIKLHQQALNIAKQINHIPFEIYSLNMLGVVYRRMDAVKSALEYHYKALQIASSTKQKSREIDENIAISNNSIGNIYLLLEKPKLAKKHFAKSLQIEKKYNNKLGLAINYQNIGGIFEEQGNYEKALEYYTKSLAYNDSIKSTVGKIICQTSIGNVYLKQGKYQSALEKIKPNIKLAEKLGDKYYTADVYLNYAQVLIKLKKYKDAKLFLDKALSVAKNKKIPSLSSEIYKSLSEIAQQNKDYKQALSYYKQYNQEQKKVYNKKNRQLVSDLVLDQIKKENETVINDLGKKNKEVSKRLNRSRKSLYFTLSLLFLLVVLGFILYQQYKLNNRRKVMNLEQSLLRAQMNPHFIFNSLNSIKLFIIHNRSKDAISFLSKFAKLIRAILNSTKEKEMSLREELEMIKLYVSIENTRLSDSINFELKVDENIDLDKVKIPSFLTQPFIENALWHGLSQKKEYERKLSISIKKQDNKTILIEIEDNGIGRKRAMEIKKSKIFNKKSIGIDLSSQRLKFFTKSMSKDYTIRFKDLFDKNKQPAGTKVIIEIPNKKQ